MNPEKKSPHGVNTLGVSTKNLYNLEEAIMYGIFWGFSNQLCLYSLGDVQTN